MRLRSFATLLVCAALAACEGDTTLPAAELVGRWESNPASLVATFPDGTRPVMGAAELTLGGNGEFRREVRYADPASGKVFPDVITEGTYTTSGSRVHVTVTRAYLRLNGPPETNATPQPVAPQTETYAYSLSGGKLTFTYVCAPNALCIEDPFPRYTRVDPNWRGSGTPAR